MQQLMGPLAGQTVAWVGDYNNVARSLAEASALLGMNVRLGCPAGYDADEAELERLILLGAARCVQEPPPADAVAGANAVHTDMWTSMGQEDGEGCRARSPSRASRSTETLMAPAAERGDVLPLPAGPPG